MKSKPKELRVVFWHNDFIDGLRAHPWYGKDGPLCIRLNGLINSNKALKWHFHGGFITPERTVLLRRLQEANVIFIACPWNMNIEDNNMHWHEAEHSLLDILRGVKEKNMNVKIYFLQRPHHLLKELKTIGEFIKDWNDEIINNYFRQIS